MRAIDSFLTFSKATGRPITVIWINNNKLNASLDDLFEPFEQDKLKIIELNPFSSLSDKLIVKCLDLAEKTISPFLRRLYLILALKRFDFGAIKTNPEWAGIYNSMELIGSNTMRETEAAFHEKTRLTLEEIMRSKQVYISSCYRLYESDDQYAKFIPVTAIQKQVDTIVSRFGQTYGLHIRAVNHPYASKYSTVDKFEEKISGLLVENADLSFFLATDSGKVKDRLLKKYGPETIITNPSEDYSRSDQEAIRQAVVDLYCLSKTKRILGSMYSSFTLTAADIGRVNDEIVK